jgi:hypothetical protein
MYDLRDLYPQLGSVTVHEQSIPERAEQQHYETTSVKAPEMVSKPGNFWMAFVVIVVLMWLFNIV